VSGTPRSGRGLLALLVVAALACALALAACGPSSVGSGASDVGNSVPQADFVGSWSGTDVMIDGAWSGTTGTFAVTPGNQGGGIVIAQTVGGLTAQLVGNSGSQSPAFPTTLQVDTLSFSVPAASGAPVTWDVQIVDPATGKALLQIGGDTSHTWDLEQVTQIPTG
jgi:hypothetical protein